MPTATRKFDNVRATRLALLLFISLTAGAGTAVLQPLDLLQHVQTISVLPFSQRLNTAVPLALLDRHRSGHAGPRR